MTTVFMIKEESNHKCRSKQKQIGSIRITSGQHLKRCGKKKITHYLSTASAFLCLDFMRIPVPTTQKNFAKARKYPKEVCVNLGIKLLHHKVTTFFQQAAILIYQTSIIKQHYILNKTSNKRRFALEDEHQGGHYQRFMNEKFSRMNKHSDKEYRKEQGTRVSLYPFSFSQTGRVFLTEISKLVRKTFN